MKFHKSFFNDFWTPSFDPGSGSRASLVTIRDAEIQIENEKRFRKVHILAVTVWNFSEQQWSAGINEREV